MSAAKPETTADAAHATASTDDKQALKVPSGPFTELPTNYKDLDLLIVHEILCVAGLKRLSQLKDHKDEKEVHWQPIGEKDGIQMHYAIVEGSNNYFFKGAGRVPASVATVSLAMRDINNMKIMDPMCQYTELIKTLDHDHHIYYAYFKMPPMIWWRDFCWYAVDYSLPDGTFVTTGKSILSDLCKDKSNMVRGEIRASGYIVQPVPDKPDECDITYIVQTDPKGWIPSWVVNIVAKSQAFNPGVIKSLVPKFAAQMKAKNTADDKEVKSTKSDDSAPPQ